MEQGLREGRGWRRKGVGKNSLLIKRVENKNIPKHSSLLHLCSIEGYDIKGSEKTEWKVLAEKWESGFIMWVLVYILNCISVGPLLCALEVSCPARVVATQNTGQSSSHLTSDVVTLLFVVW